MAEIEARRLATSLTSSGDILSPAPQHRRITKRMRSTLCGWLVEVSQEFNLHQDTLFLGVSLLDRFLSLQPAVTKHELQLVGTGCLFIAAKQEEVTFPGLTAFADIANNSFTQKQLGKMEICILEVLQYKVASPTVHILLHSLVSGMKLDKQAAALAAYLLELSMVETCTVFNPPSVSALAAVLVAACLTDVNGFFRLWNCIERSLEPYLLKSIGDLLALYGRAYAERNALDYIYVVKEKFSSSSWYAVSIVLEPNQLKSHNIPKSLSVQKQDTLRRGEIMEPLQPGNMDCDGTYSNFALKLCNCVQKRIQLHCNIFKEPCWILNHHVTSPEEQCTWSARANLLQQQLLWFLQLGPSHRGWADLAPRPANIWSARDSLDPVSAFQGTAAHPPVPDVSSGAFDYRHERHEVVGL
eukprot:CAMPEP_0177586016 /NCGR_PEP_ID=MMETSP0419_2-20121207/4830_1 /TAXON_ID=582737 /ORGANISM="Tetraselmis sp., Strain GSL018" /LENGTH=412 /DNA_ID=CAMNT_0019075845 /DNA_START=410 /DNA_END=1647 /DNA_ORIENTATION=-